MLSARFKKMADGSYSGVIPSCRGVIAFGSDKETCREELQSVLESWILLGIKLGHSLPIIHGINLNKEPLYEQNNGM